MNSILANFKKNELIEVYTRDGEINRCIVGYVVATNEEETLLATVTPRGRADGFYSLLTADISSVSTETQYIQKIERLYKVRNSGPHYVINFGNENIFFNVLELAKEEEKLVSISILDSVEYRARGFIEDISENGLITVCEINSFGQKEGKTFVEFDDINQIVLNGEEEQDMTILYLNYFYGKDK